jgi:tetratricopeptide (TPR) repeat protein
VSVLALTFSIVSNFVITIGTICAERLMYLPSAGFVMAAGAAAGHAATSFPRHRRVLQAVLVILLALGAARTWHRNEDWHTDLTLWSSAIEVAPRSARVQTEYGRVLMLQAQSAAEAGRARDAERLYAAAQAHYETALQIYPSYAVPMDGLATIYSLHQRFDDAITLYDRAVKVFPGNYASLTNWGGLLWDRSLREGSRVAELRTEGRLAEAESLARDADAGFRDAARKIDQALAIRPSYAHAHLIRALILAGYEQDRSGAIAEFETVLRLAPNHAQRALIEQELARLRTQAPVPTPGR